MRKALVVTAAVMAAVIFFLLATLPPRASRAAANPHEPLRRRTLAGAYHVHTTRSDGTGSREEVAAAAARAGLQFVIFTDHGDGTRTPDPPGYLHGVLCLDGVEISTNGGHYVALDLPATPYPLGGEADAVAEDVRRLGGFGAIAHPDSPKESLQWRDWSIPADGVEWLNADTAWRDEPVARLVRLPFDYLFRPSPALASMLDRPVATLARWDGMTSHRPITGLAGHDAHGGLSGRLEDGRRITGLRLPSYEATFRTFSQNLIVAEPLTGDPAEDGRRVIDAVRRGSAFTAITAIAAPAWIDFRGRQSDYDAGIGELLRPDAPVALTVRGPRTEGAVTALVCNGNDVEVSAERELSREITMTGSCRAEIRVAGAPGEPPVPWIVTNPIYLGHIPAPSETAAAPLRLERVAEVGEWTIEKDPGSRAEVRRDASDTTIDFRLRPGPAVSQYVAIAAPLTAPLPEFDQLIIRARSDRPMRASVQLRFGDERWVRSVYLSPEGSEVAVPTGRLRPAHGGSPSLPDFRRASSILLVVDLVNALPGAGGTLSIRDVFLARRTLKP